MSLQLKKDLELYNAIIYVTSETLLYLIEVFLNPVYKGLAKNLLMTVCDGIINLSVDY